MATTENSVESSDLSLLQEEHVQMSLMVSISSLEDNSEDELPVLPKLKIGDLIVPPYLHINVNKDGSLFLRYPTQNGVGPLIKESLDKANFPYPLRIEYQIRITPNGRSSLLKGYTNKENKQKLLDDYRDIDSLMSEIVRKVESTFGSNISIFLQ